jgi:hypothetical protein
LIKLCYEIVCTFFKIVCISKLVAYILFYSHHKIHFFGIDKIHIFHNMIFSTLYLHYVLNKYFFSKKERDSFCFFYLIEKMIIYSNRMSVLYKHKFNIVKKKKNIHKSSQHRDNSLKQHNHASNVIKSYCPKYICIAHHLINDRTNNLLKLICQYEQNEHCNKFFKKK